MDEVRARTQEVEDAIILSWSDVVHRWTAALRPQSKWAGGGVLWMCPLPIEKWDALNNPRETVYSASRYDNYSLFTS